MIKLCITMYGNRNAIILNKYNIILHVSRAISLWSFNETIINMSIKCNNNKKNYAHNTIICKYCVCYEYVYKS